jgi:dihydropteroate synthase
MGVLNVTPDSFSGDGVPDDPDRAAALALDMVRAGADLIDVGGESTRPGAGPVDPTEQLRRVVPVIAALRRCSEVPISVDTSAAAVADAAVEAGADLVNDVLGLAGDPELARVVAAAGVPVVLMHNQRLAARASETEPEWPGDVMAAVHLGLVTALGRATAAGIDPGRVVFDPGFGFGWSAAQNLQLLRRLPELWDLGLPLLVGTSRKSTIGELLAGPDGRPRTVGQRVMGTAATVAVAICGGADIVRVHDVAAMHDVARVVDAIVR